ncbi:MAG: hypothetical protein JWO15_2225 [Sphingomonadales bacterium]|nr:hypothetical protein [Sphingomonadales bacterium]
MNAETISTAPNRIALEDRFAIHELVALYGHIVDDRDPLRKPGELFTEDVQLDMRPLGGNLMTGLPAVERQWADPGRPQRVMHQTGNIVLTPRDADAVDYIFKGIGVGASGRVGSAHYSGHVARTGQGWRFATMTCKPMLLPKREAP